MKNTSFLASVLSMISGMWGNPFDKSTASMKVPPRKNIGLEKRVASSIQKWNAEVDRKNADKIEKRKARKGGKRKARRGLDLGN